jgi:hypothetical protein
VIGSTVDDTHDFVAGLHGCLQVLGVVGRIVGPDGQQLVEGLEQRRRFGVQRLSLQVTNGVVVDHVG